MAGLPTDPNTLWPPLRLEEPFHQIETWRAWYSGNTDHLTAVYGGPAALPVGSPARSFFDVDRPGLRGAIGRWFWGQPATAGQQASKLHIPLAGDVAELSANLLFSDVPTVTADLTGPASDATATTDRLRSYLDDSGHAALREAAEIAAGLSGVYLRVVWDEDIADRPWITVIQPDAAVPEWRWDRLTACTFWRVVDDDDGVWRLLERHEKGAIVYGLFHGDQDKLGRRMALADHPGVEELIGASTIAQLTQGDTVETGVDRLLVTYIPNVKPNRMWHDIPGAEHLGRSDYASLEPLMDELDEVWTSWMRDIRLAKARIMVPQSMLDTDGPGGGATFDLDREVFVPLNMLEGPDGGGITINQFAIRVDEHARTAQALVEQILRSAGYSSQSYGLDGTVAVTATEVAARKEQSLTTRGQKILYVRPALKDVLETLLLVDSTVFKTKVDPEADLTISWPDAVAPDPEAVARTLSLLDAAGAVSQETKVRMVHPEWDEEKVAEEVRRIRGGQARAGGMPPNLAGGGGFGGRQPADAGVPGVPAEPVVDPAAGDAGKAAAGAVPAAG